MLNTQALRDILKSVFGVEDRYLVPISTNWFIPTVDPDDHVGSWIGYRIISKKPFIRTYQVDIHKVKPVRVSFRLSFVGPQAEELADQVLLWEERTDVTKAFEEYETQINYQDRTCFTYPIRNGGYNDEIAWIVDLSAQTTYEVNTKQVPWFHGN